MPTARTFRPKCVVWTTAFFTFLMSSIHAVAPAGAQTRVEGDSPVFADAPMGAIAQGGQAPWQTHPGCGVTAVEEYVGDGGCGPCGEECGPRGGPCADSCGEPCFAPCVFQPLGRFAFRAEYLSWWSKSANLPALLSGDLAGNDVLFGGSDGDLGARSGARLGLDWWFDPCRTDGLEFNYMFLSEASANFAAESDGSQILARPFFNVETALRDSAVLAYPDVQTGSMLIDSSSELSSVEALYRRALICMPDRRFDFLLGYRYARLHEELSLDGTTTYISRVGQLPVGTVIAASDLFDAKNEFHGGEIGFAAQTRHCRWSLELLAKLALGGCRSTVGVGGATTISIPDQPTATYNSGMLALGTNRGEYDRTALAVIPELGVTLGFDLTCNLKATFGYTFLYWSQVSRPGDQIDTNLNPTQFPPGTLSGLPSPQFKFATTDYWAQGINVGLEYRF